MHAYHLVQYSPIFLSGSVVLLLAFAQRLSQTQVPQQIDGHPQEAEKNCLVCQQGASERESPLPVMGPSEAVSRDGPAAGLRLLKIDAAATP